MATPLQAVLNAEASFTPRMETVPGDLRREWRLAALLVLLWRCNRRSATMQQIQVFGRAMLDSAARQAIAGTSNRDPFALEPVIRNDPAWMRAVELSIGLGLVNWADNGRAMLTDAGTGLATTIAGATGLMVPERAALDGLSLTQAAVDRLLSRHR
jgi:hypothetical protein